MPRGERPLDSDDGPLAQFAADLRRLREKAGSPTYRELARRAHYSASTLSDAAGGRKLPGLAVTLAYVRACGGDVAAWEQRWTKLAAELAGPPPITEPDTDNRQSPYPGLAAFQPDDTDRFFGRETVVTNMVERLATSRFLAVFGASGAGKSSVLRAGLVPTLRASVPVVVFTPGPHPIEECAIALAGLTGQSPATLRAEFIDEPDALHLRVRQAMRERSGDDLVLVVDQFEEVFTLCADPEERARFIAVLISASQASTSRVRVVLGVRTDFYTHCAAHPDLVEALQDAQLLLAPLSTDQLRSAIAQPAIATGLRVEAALLATLTAEATGQAGVLPLLSHALRETWRRRHGTTLTLAGYQAAGGIGHAIARTADTAYTALTERQQRIARDLFLRLTALGEDGHDLKRRVRRHELDTADTQLTVVLERLARARLIVLDEDRVDLAHEALIRCWPRLHEWLAADQEGLRIHRQLTEATDTWEAAHQDEGALYRGSRLAVAREWATRCEEAPTPRERRFLAASAAAENRDRRAVLRRNRQLRWLAVGLTVLFAASALLATVARAQSDEADTQRADAISRQLAAEAGTADQPDAAMLLAIAAYRQANTAEARSALLSVQAQHTVVPLATGTGAVPAIAFSPDGRLLAIGDTAGDVQLWEAGTHTLIATLPGDTPVSSLTFSPDSQILASAARDAITLWRAATHARIGQLTGVPGTVSEIAASPDGRLLAAAAGHTVRLWDLATGQPHRDLTVDSAAVHGVAFSPDGRLVATADDNGTVQLWDPAAGTPPNTLNVAAGPVRGVLFSPDGHRLATLGPDATVSLWDTGTWQRVSTVGGSTDGLAGQPLDARSGAAFSPDGQTLAISHQGGVTLWDVATQALVTTLSMRWGAQGVPVAFSPNGGTLATPDGDGVGLWDLRGATLTAHPVAIQPTVAFSPTGQLLATGGLDGLVRLWNPTTHALLASMAGPPSLAAMTFGADGRMLATRSQTGPVQIWDVATRRVVTTFDGANGASVGLSTGVNGHVLVVGQCPSGLAVWDATANRLITTLGASAADSVAVSPDGSLLAVADADRAGAVSLWDLRTGRLAATFPGSGGSVVQLAFSPDSHALAVASDSTVVMWDTRRRTRVTGPSEHTGGAAAVAFSPDGTVLATADADDNIRLWTVPDGALIATLTGATNAVMSLAFNPAGNVLASTGLDYTTRLWNLRPEQVAHRLCGLLGPVTPTRWAHLIPNLPYQPVCP